MGKFGTYYKGEKKKLKKAMLEKKARSFTERGTFILPKIEIIKKGKNEG